MSEIFNVLAAFVCGLVAGAAIHSAWLHTQKRKRRLISSGYKRR